MKPASEVFTLAETFDLTLTRTGETRSRSLSPNHGPDYDGPEASEIIAEERCVLTHPDGRQGETWMMVEEK